MNFKVTSRSEKETMNIAENIESEKFPNMVICLDGELGSGKTVFVKGFASSLGITEVITSPTFNLVKEYPLGELPLYHMDVYRLEEDSSDIGLEEYFNKGGVTIIEWSELIKERLPKERLDVRIIVKDENTRVLVFTPHGKIYEDICSSVL